MKLQISFDLIDLDKALKIAHLIAPHTHIIEVGTLLIHHYGSHAVQQFKESFPNKVILADTKIVDKPKESATIFGDVGADWITVLAGTNKNTIHALCTAAHNLNMKVMLDLIDSSSLAQSALEAKNLGIDAILFHKPLENKEPMVLQDQWEMIRGNTSLPIFISAQIKRDNIESILLLKPDGIIIGKGIVEAENPQEEAQFFYDICNR